MSISSYAIVELSTGQIVNSCVWDGVRPWQPPDGHIAVKLEAPVIGWYYDVETGEQVPPVAREP